MEKLWTKENGVHWSENLFPLVGMKVFVEIQYSVLWKLRYGQNYFRLVETIIGIRAAQFSKKEIILVCVQPIFRLVETIFFHLWDLASFFLCSGKIFFKKILVFGWWKRILELIMVSTDRKKAVNKKILFSIDRNFESTNQNEGFVKKIRFYYAEKLLSPAGISRKTVINGFQ